MGCVTEENSTFIPSLTIIGGGPGGYEAAMVAAKLGARVTLVERQGVGGAAVLTDVVPSKTLIATADSMRRVGLAEDLGVDLGDAEPRADMRQVDRRILDLAGEQSRDIRAALERRGVRVIDGVARVVGPNEVSVRTLQDADAEPEVITSDAILVAVGASPRELPTAVPDGERIFNWKQLYAMTELPEHLIVVGSGVTGAEFASAYNRLGAKVTLVSSRDRVLPGEDADAAELLEKVFQDNGLTVVARSRAEAVERTETGVRVELSGEGAADTPYVEGSHALVAVGGIPNTAGLGLEDVGVELTESGHVKVDGVSRTTVPSIYAAGDCTGNLALASVAAMQGRIAVAHLLGDALKPLRPHLLASNIFTSPEIATVGVTQAQVDSGQYQADVLRLDFATNPRAKMSGVQEGFVKIFARQGSGTVIGGVVVSPRASELIYALALAVTHKLHVDDLADTFTVYPSMSGSIAEAARRLHVRI
ncbi:NAD(P)H-quinone dehydrogenase [Micrococcus endophyticus]|uniref:NAD(P)H-quinone dehydrogenase n=1 Tax=Micrococcus endophyticus TaxID=455343 RepID=UPI0020038B50|nr:NAD(P)H-quinone dehydrogenase [Micrococcus endophyticus]MCK6091636.1 NAD(P)H-quinone dehydrogenase [Micrococcus endophyticus]